MIRCFFNILILSKHIKTKEIINYILILIYNFLTLIIDNKKNI